MNKLASHGNEAAIRADFSRSSNRLPLPAICLCGPTAAGKTALALELARKLDCEIINADSRQIYADFPIVTAQPDEKERQSAPHHLYGFLKTGEKLNAFAWARLAYAQARKIISRGRLPLLVGGSGFYFQALLTSLPEIPPVDPEIGRQIAQRLAACGSPALHGELSLIDPQYASRIHPNDRQRVQRALEVYAATGKTFSWWHARSLPAPFCEGPLLLVDASLEKLEPAIKSRIKRMQACGVREEIVRAWKNCPDASAPGWSGIGCRETLAYLQGRINFGEWQRNWAANTRAYAKRQLTWFRGRKSAIPVQVADAAAIIALSGVRETVRRLECVRINAASTLT